MDNQPDYINGCAECGKPLEPIGGRRVLWHWSSPIDLCDDCWMKFKNIDHRQWLLKIIEWCNKKIKYGIEHPSAYWLATSYEEIKESIEKALKEFDKE